jgi:hypothetical protein
LQRIGAFKVRGAFHAVKRLVAEVGVGEVMRRGVVTHSSGMVCFVSGLRPWIIPSLAKPLTTLHPNVQHPQSISKS